MRTSALAKRPQSFAPSHRLHYPWEYRRFFSKSQVFRLSHCVVFRIPNEHEHCRVGITIKARGRSVDRNRAKRRVREFFRHHTDRLGKFDYNVVIPSSRKLDFPYPQRLAECLGQEFLRALGK